jgi:uridine kinase
MKGDILVIHEYHKRAASEIVPQIIERIREKNARYIIAVAGESGSGKSETSSALSNELEKYGIKSVILGQDDYFILPPKANSAKRREDPDWLGPHVEVKLDVLDQNLKDAVQGKNEIIKPLVDYDANTIEEETISLKSCHCRGHLHFVAQKCRYQDIHYQELAGHAGTPPEKEPR